MSLYSIPRALEDQLGKPASAALAEMLRAMFDDERREGLARIDEKVVGRYAEIQRRSHEDVAGVELRLTEKLVQMDVRLTQKIGDVEARLTQRIGDVETRMAALEGRVAERLTAMEGRLSEKIAVRSAQLETRFTRGIAEAKNAMIVWLVGALVVQSGLMVVVAWASKHLP